MLGRVFQLLGVRRRGVLGGSEAERSENHRFDGRNHEASAQKTRRPEDF